MGHSVVIVALSLVGLGWSGALPAGEPAGATGAASALRPNSSQPNKPEQSKYLRLVRDKAGTVTALETAIVRFLPRNSDKKTPAVDLIGAVHIADHGYFEKLNREFENYDVVLYEMVAPEGTKIAPGKHNPNNPLSAMQVGMGVALGLEYQLHVIRYDRKNFVHADMSPEGFLKSLKDRNESLVDEALRAAGYALASKADSATGDDFQLLLALFDKNRARGLKRVMAKQQLEDVEGMLSAMEGPKGSTLIGERNKAALAVLRKQLEAGKEKIAIFYGAGHMPNMAQRLSDDFNLVRSETRWLTAWDMK